MLEHVDVLVVELEVLLRAEAAELLPHVPFLLSAGAAVRAPSAGAGFRRGTHRFPRLLKLYSIIGFRSERNVVVLPTGGRRRARAPAPGAALGPSGAPGTPQELDVVRHHLDLALLDA